MPRTMRHAGTVAVSAAMEKIRHSDEMSKLKSLADRAASGEDEYSFPLRMLRAAQRSLGRGRVRGHPREAAILLLAAAQHSPQRASLEAPELKAAPTTKHLVSPADAVPLTVSDPKLVYPAQARVSLKRGGGRGGDGGQPPRLTSSRLANGRVHPAAEADRGCEPGCKCDESSEKARDIVGDYHTRPYSRG